jgi:hypothetical protein
MHCSLLTMHYALFTIHSAPFTAHHSLCTIHCSLCTMHYSDLLLGASRVRDTVSRGFGRWCHGSRDARGFSRAAPIRPMASGVGRMGHQRSVTGAPLPKPMHERGWARGAGQGGARRGKGKWGSGRGFSRAGRGRCGMRRKTTTVEIDSR